MTRFIKDLWTVEVERAKARRAMRMLTRQSWSLEFMIYLLNKSVELSRKNGHMVLRNKDGQEIVLYAGMPGEQNVHQGRQDELDVRQSTLSWEAVRDAAEASGLL